MSNFSNILTKLMDRKGSVNNEVIRYTGIDRSTFFKIKNGSRNPSGRRTVEKIADGLRLNEEDRRLLVEAYEIDQMGPYMYYGIQSVKRFFLTERRFSGRRPVTIVIPEFQDSERVRVFRNVSEVIAVIYGMLYEKSPQIRILENSMNDIFATVVPQAAQASPETEFVHIFMLDDTETIGIDQQLYNVNCFRNVMNTLIQTDRYFPRYYYSPVSALTGCDLQNNFIMNDRFLLTYSEGYKSAVLYEDPEMLELYRDIFEEYLNRSVPFAVSENGAPVRTAADDAGPDFDRDVYVMCPSLNCLLSTEDIEKWISRYMRDDLPQAETFAEKYLRYAERIKKRLTGSNGTWHMISARNSVVRFFETGQISGVLGRYMSVFSNEDRTVMLRQWKVRAEFYNVRTVREKCSPDSSDLCVLSSSREAVIMFMDERDMELKSFRVREPGITALIYAYLEKLENDSAMEKEEYRNFMDSFITKTGRQLS